MAAALFVILLPPLALVLFDSVCRALFLVVAWLPERQRERPEAEGKSLRLLALVLAHNEERTIEQTLRRLKEQTDADTLSDVAVLADHCSDQTVPIANGMGVRVHLREQGLQGKSQALSWLVQEQQEALSRVDVVAILDADTLVEPGFCDAMRAAFEPEVEAVQGFVNPVSANGFPLTTLVSFSEILSERIDDAARRRLRWSVPLRGTGMAFRTGTFVEACRQLGTQVDDIELSVRLAEMGVRVHMAPAAIVDDPKSDQVLGLARQRGRWLKGQRQVWKVKSRSIVKLLRSGAANWSLIQAMLLKPKTALVAMRLAMLAVLWARPLGQTTIGGLLLAVAAGGLLIDAVYYLSGLRFAEHAGKTLVSLLISPLLLVLWAISWGYSLLPTQEWLRAQKR